MGLFMSKLTPVFGRKIGTRSRKIKLDYLGSNSRDIFVTGANTYVQIALENIKPNKFQPRMVFLMS